MTDEALANVIAGVNSGILDRQAFLQHLKDNVWVGMVWPELPQGRHEIGFRMFLIRDGDGPFVAIVQDGGSDLHIFVLPEHRKKGLMTTALKEVILPYLLRPDGSRWQQDVTFENPKMSRYLKRIGFRITGKNSATIMLSDLPTHSIPEPTFVVCDKRKAEHLHQRMKQAAELIRMCLAELQTTGKQYRLQELESAAYDVADLATDMLELLWND